MASSVMTQPLDASRPALWLTRARADAFAASGAGDSLTMAWEGNPILGRNRMAVSGHTSPQDRHTMPASARQPSPIIATGSEIS